MHDPFQTTAAVLAVATVVGLVATRLRQPLLVAFIAVGVIVGPAALGLVEQSEPLELFAEIGIAVLLFLVGLKLDVQLIRTTGPVALITGLGQVIFTSTIGFGLGLLLGLGVTPSIYVAVALTFSSTIIVVKLLSDKRELEQLHGRIAIGFLIVQDIVVVLVMITLVAVGGEREDDGVLVEVLSIFGKGAALLVGMAAMMRWVLPLAVHQLARSRELLIVSAIAWAVSVATLSDELGFSTEVGAFLAGFALASTPFRESIASSLAPLRDFLVLFFFIELGSGLDFSSIGSQVPAAVVLSVFVLVGNPIIVMVLMGLMGYRSRVSFQAGLTVAQISEFSLILIALGRQLEHVDDDAVGLVTLVGLITIGLSTYLILYSHPLYARLAPLLHVFERKQPTRGGGDDAGRPVDVILYGHGRYGSELAQRFLEAGMCVLVVDFDPYASRVVDDRLEVVYGDAEDDDFPGSLPLHRARWVVSAIPGVEVNKMLVSALRRWHFDGRVALTAHSSREAADLHDYADLVLQPFRDASAATVRQLLEP